MRQILTLMTEVISQTVREFPQRPLEAYTHAAQIRYTKKIRRIFFGGEFF
ncbi:MAG: hypothetical protein IKE46_03665 [Selenomonadaceae bacterium]|nr:hypothetical protein [Selenomonadaceae bacterium]